jgi:hypothetical protein
MSIEIKNRQRAVLKDALISYLNTRIGTEAVQFAARKGYIEYMAEFYVNHRSSSHPDDFKRLKLK